MPAPEAAAAGPKKAAIRARVCEEDSLAPVVLAGMAVADVAVADTAAAAAAIFSLEEINVDIRMVQVDCWGDWKVVVSKMWFEFKEALYIENQHA